VHLILTAFGSYGDVLPMAGIGAAARRRGHRVQIIANPYFRHVAEAADLELLPLGSAEEYLELAQHADLWHPRRGLKVIFRRGVAAYLDHVYGLLRDNFAPGDTVIAAHGLDLASRVFHDKVGAPMATVHFAPFALPSVYETPHYIGAAGMNYAPRWLKRAVFWSLDRWMVDPLIAPDVNRLRAEQGLPLVRRIFHRWNHSPELVLGMFPEWFAAPQPDWPPQIVLVGFPLWDSRPDAALPAEVEAFLAAGAPPIVFAPGSANFQAHDFFHAAAEACTRLGRRGMLMTKADEQVPAKLPDGVAHFAWAPFSRLLPRAAALVHHGGIGTCGQGLAAATPQVVMPMAYDQLDNGMRLKRLGVGAVVRVPQFRGPKLAATLQPLLESEEVKTRAAALAPKCNGPAALTRACDKLESLHRRGAGTTPANSMATTSPAR